MIAIFAIPTWDDFEIVSKGFILPKFLPPASLLLKPESVTKPGFVLITLSFWIWPSFSAPATVTGLINEPGSKKSSTTLFLSITLSGLFGLNVG